MAKIPIFLEPLNPLPDDLDAWAERVVEQIKASRAAIEAEDGHPAPGSERGKPLRHDQP